MSQGFPEPHWGKEDISPVFKPFYAVASSPVGSRFVRLLVPLDRRFGCSPCPGANTKSAPGMSPGADSRQHDQRM
jgi:hypothetical protein